MQLYYIPYICYQIFNHPSWKTISSRNEKFLGINKRSVFQYENYYVQANKGNSTSSRGFLTLGISNILKFQHPQNELYHVLKRLKNYKYL